MSPVLNQPSSVNALASRLGFVVVAKHDARARRLDLAVCRRSECWMLRIGLPTVPSFTLDGLFDVMTGDVSVSPYPCIIAIPAPVKIRKMSSGRAAPPVMQARSRPPKNSRSLL